MTVYRLRELYWKAHPDGHFFDRDSLKFFGERMSEMRILKGTVWIKSADEKLHECFVLSTLQHKHPNGPARVYHYFDVITLDQIII